MYVEEIEQEASGRLQLKQFGLLMTNHERKLSNILQRPHCQLSPPINRFNLIEIKLRPTVEQISILRLCETDNVSLRKILLTFSYLCRTVNDLKLDGEKLLMRFQYFDDQLGQIDSEGGVAVKISEQLEFFHCCYQFLERCRSIAVEIVRQLTALFDPINQLASNQSSIHFNIVFDSLADIALIACQFDGLISGTGIKNHWTTYRRAIERFHHNQIPSPDGLINVITEIDRLFVDDHFGKFIETTVQIQEFSIINDRRSVLEVFSRHVDAYIRHQLMDCSSGVILIRVTAISCLAHTLFGNFDGKLFRQLIDACGRNAAITLSGNLLWIPEKFIRKYAATLAQSYETRLQDFQRQRVASLQRNVQELIRDFGSQCIQIAIWILQFQVTIQCKSAEINLEKLRQRYNIISLGFELFDQCSATIKSITNLHAMLNQRMQKQCVTAILKLSEYLQAFQMAVTQQSAILIETIHGMGQHISYQLLSHIDKAKKKLTTNLSTYNEITVDILSAMTLAEKLLYGPVTLDRIQLIRLSLSLSDPLRTFSTETLNKITDSLQRLVNILQLNERINAALTFDYFFWHQSLMWTYLKQFVESNIDYERISNFLQSLTEIDQGVRRMVTDNLMNDNHRKSINLQLKIDILSPIFMAIETMLRYDAHACLQQQRPVMVQKFIINPTDIRYALIGRNSIGPTVQLFGEHFMWREQIEHYMSEMFYNLTTVSLHDWRTYGEMRCFAKYRFHLDTVPDHLPNQTLEQGLDVLEIMRNIHVFVEKYMYNLNNQIFIEHTSNNKHLNTINIGHIANSLRTHGTGVINTTVNIAYQFLRQKFHLFSQLMYDEHIKSRLMKDLKSLRDGQRERTTAAPYTYERAIGFIRFVQKLGVDPQTGSVTYLHSFRMLITHIGNAMGYVRMMRSGGIHSCATASIYLPKLYDDDFWTDSPSYETVDNLTVIIANNLRMDMEHLTPNNGEATQYFKLLVDAFAATFRSAKTFSHLRNFYLLVPALTINYIEHIVAAKEMLARKHKAAAIFTDDGFAMGLAYVLRMLDQTNDFNALHWFREMRQKYVRDLATVQDSNGRQSGMSEKLQQTLSLSEQRIATYRQEYDLLYCNLSSARIFFQ